MHESEATCFERIGQYVVLANLDARQLRFLKKANIPICDDNLTGWTDQFGQPPGD